MNSREVQTQKLKEIEDLVEHDLSNGRTAQKELHSRIKKQGRCAEKLCQELKNLKNATE